MKSSFGVYEKIETPKNQTHRAKIALLKDLSRRFLLQNSATDLARRQSLEG